MQKAHLWLGAALAVVACGSGSVGSDPDAGIINLAGLDRIDVTPQTLTLTIQGDAPQMATYTAMGHFSDGHTQDITSATSFELDNSTIGAFSQNQLTTHTTNGGKATITASASNQKGQAFLTVKIVERYTDPQGSGVPSDPGNAFGGSASDANKPDVVYPVNNVLLPPNLGKIEIHFLPGSGNGLFELSFQSDTTDVKIYTSCVNPLNGGCIFMPEPKVWTWLAESNRGRNDLQVTMRGTSGAGAAVGTSTSLTLAFSQDDIQGAMYYWTTPKGQNDPDGKLSRILRWDFASTTQTAPLEIAKPDDTGGHCVGCHAVSPDGSKLFVTSEGSYDAYVLLKNLATGQNIEPWNSTDPVAFASWEWPNGARFVGTFSDSKQSGFVSDNLNLFSGADGSFLQTIDVGGSDTRRVTHPDWSPDTTMIAFTRIGQSTAGNLTSGTQAYGFRSQIGFVTKQGNGWSAPTYLNDPTAGNPATIPPCPPPAQGPRPTPHPPPPSTALPYPDTALLLFNRSACPGGTDGSDCDMYDDPTATLWIMPPHAGATPIRLDNANAPGKTETRTVVENSFAKWTPFTFQRTGEFGTRLFWFTFSSDRKAGLREPIPGAVLIWMSGLDPDGVLQGDDGSAPAFLLPFQDLTRDNHTAQWTQTAVIIP